MRDAHVKAELVAGGIVCVGQRSLSFGLTPRDLYYAPGQSGLAASSDSLGGRTPMRIPVSMLYMRT